MAFIRAPFGKLAGTPKSTQTRSSEESEVLELLRTLNRLPEARKPTEEEVVVAAWANLAIEEKDLTLDEARRILVPAVP